jgi:zinc finger protein
MKLTNIPHFKEIILMCFTCESCGYKSVDVKPGGEICEHGVEFRLQVQDARIDLSRDVIKSADAYVCIPE